MLIYGGPGHNILIGRRQRRADRRLGDQHPGGRHRQRLALYGGGIPAVYQNIINSLGAGIERHRSSQAPDVERADDLAAAAAGRPQRS